jgi:hypothetical protein
MKVEMYYDVDRGLWIVSLGGDGYRDVYRSLDEDAARGVYEFLDEGTDDLREAAWNNAYK